MCDPDWINVFPLGNGSYPCCDHNDRPRNLFLAWHRPYLKQFELALHDAGLEDSKGLPYWDWTEGEDEDIVRLPDLATREPAWRTGEVPSVGRTTRAQPNISAISLRTKVRTALCQTNYQDFQEQIDVPHNEVHSIVVGGSMGNLLTAAYDPIFYLHHSNVDRYYAYWQALQDLRGLGSLTTQIHNGQMVNNFQMPPFTMRDVNPFFSVTGNPTQARGVEYQANYCYQYDTLLFDGLTPEQFYQEESQLCGSRQFATVFTRATNTFTRNDLLLLDRSRNNQVVATLQDAFVTAEKPWKTGEDQTLRRPFLIDVTDLTRNLPDPNNLDFEVVSFGFNRLDPKRTQPFKPISEFVTASGSKKLRVRVEDFSSYYPDVRTCSLDASVGFLGRDGSVSDQVTLQSRGRKVSSPFQIIRKINKFVFEDNVLNIGYDPSCHISCDARGFPVETNPCAGRECVEVVAWNLETLRRNNNAVSVKKSTAIVGWCQEVDVQDIFEVDTEADFTECRNIPSEPVMVETEGGLDGFLVRRGQRPRYFVSRDRCEDGLKIKITFQ